MTSGHSGFELAEEDIQVNRHKCFNPTAFSHPKSSILSQGQQIFVDKYFKEVVPDESIVNTILDKSPVPHLEVLESKKLYIDILDLMPHKSQRFILSQDLGLASASRRTTFALGPLSKLWS